MDPVSVFRALYDSKCIKFGQYDLKSGLVAPYYVNLRRLPLYPKLMEAIVNQAVEKFLNPQALNSVMAQMRREQQLKQQQHSSGASLDSGLDGKQYKQQQSYSCVSQQQHESDADSQLEDEIETCSEEGCEEHEHSRLSATTFKPIISGVPYGAVPLAATIAYKAQLPFLLERKESKQYGDDQQSLVDDFVSEHNHLHHHHHLQDNSDQQQQQQQSVILIEDVICSGESTLEAVRSIEKLGLKVEFVVAIVDRDENGINLLLEQQGIKVFSLYNMAAILRVLEATGRISAEQFVTTRQWIANNQFKSIGVNPASQQAAAAARKACVGQQQQQQIAPIEVISN